MSRKDWGTPEHGLDRLAAGIQTFSKAVRMLLARNDLTHHGIVRLSQWCNPWGMTWLSTSQVSNLRTGGLRRVGPQTLDALGQINLRLAQKAGATGLLIDALPPFGPIPDEFDLPDEPFYLRRQDGNQEPLDAGGLFMVWIGRLKPAGVGEDGHISDMEARRLSGNLSRIVQSWARDRRLTIGEALEEVLRGYPADEFRRKRLKAVAVGFEVFSGEQLTEELPALGAMLGSLDGDGAIEASNVRERLYRLPRD